MPLWRMIKGKIINPTVGEILPTTIKITNPAVVHVWASIFIICSKLVNIMIGIMLATSLVVVVACSALALCIPEHVPRIVEVFFIKMKVGDPGNDQLRTVKLLLLVFWQFSSNCCFPPGLTTNYST